MHLANRYDLILLDLLMPELDGFGVKGCEQTPMKPGCR